ncbi:MAG: hypothetical protein HYT87_10305 [Nitrospirae bacterium]|nr:hypothetical protein [Nitrospirota bacterium]
MPDDDEVPMESVGPLAGGIAHDFNVRFMEQRRYRMTGSTKTVFKGVLFLGREIGPWALLWLAFAAFSAR